MPDCPRCDSRDSLHDFGSVGRDGVRWFYCSTCSWQMELDADERVLREIPPGGRRESDEKHEPDLE